MLIALLAACGTNTTTYNGTQVSEYFPLEGERSAVYTNEDTTITTQLYMEKAQPSTMEDGVEVAEFDWYDYLDDTVGDLKYVVLWSMESGSSVKIHGFAWGTDAITTFDPPLAITDSDDHMLTGDSIESTTQGSDGVSYTVTGTLVEPVPECPTTWISSWTDCIHYNLDDGGAGLPFAGDYTLEVDYGPAWFQLTGDTGEWNLLRYDYASGE